MPSISGLGGSDALYVPLSQSRTVTTQSNYAPLTEEQISVGLQGFAPNVEASNTGPLFNTIADGIYKSKNLGDVGAAIDAYTASLPNSNVYMSTYTTPSTAFLKDLAAIKSDATSDNLTAAATDMVKAQKDSPDTVANAEADALAAHDTAGLADVYMEAGANIADDYMAEGISASNAQVQSTAFVVNMLVYKGNSTPQETQTRNDQIADLATALNSTTQTNLHSEATFGNSMFEVLYDLIQSTAAVDTSDLSTPQKLDQALAQQTELSNKALASLDRIYGNNVDVAVDDAVVNANT